MTRKVHRVAASQAASEPQPMEVQIPMIALPIQGAQLNVLKGEDGSRLIVVGPVLLRLEIPLDEQNAKTVSRDLAGGIEIASSLDLPPAA